MGKKCYLMIEDIDEGVDAGCVQWAIDWGLAPGEELPQEVGDLTPSQEAMRNFGDVLRTMFDARYKKDMQRDLEGRIVVPVDAVTN